MKIIKVIYLYFFFFLRKLFELTPVNAENDSQPSAVGLTIFLDKIVTVLKEDDIVSEYVVICSLGKNPFSKVKDSVFKKLWEAGVKCYVEQTIQVAGMIFVFSSAKTKTAGEKMTNFF